MRISELVAKVAEARARREEVIARVCGACGNKCCHEMTMMGSQDLRRLLKGMRLDPDLDRRLRAGLRQRALELEADLAAVDRVASLLEAAATEEQQDDLEELRGHMQQWRDFIQFLRSDFPPAMDEMRRLMYFSAIRSNTLNCLGRFPGAQGALVTLSQGEASFRFSGRRLAPPWCLYYVEPDGCLAGDWKPAKCANFFCTGDPNLLAEMRQALSFDDFVLSNFTVASLDRFLRHLELERSLGADFVEPKIVLGISEWELGEIRKTLEAAGVQVQTENLGGRGMRSASEVETSLAALPPSAARIEVYDSTDGNALYELALGLDRIRLRDEHPGLVLVAGELGPAPMSHPMWEDEMMSQPLGALDLYVLEGGQ